MAQINGNRAVEDAAIGWVLTYEEAQGRDPRDTRGARAPADIESPPRTIEVKAYGGSARGQDPWLETRQVEEARSNPDFHVYVIENVRQGDPGTFRLHDLGGERQAKLIARARPQSYYLVPWPVSDYDGTDER